ncbi:hypothetical protein B1F79_04350 [Coxiella-like endosymbiont of Rhipicephalus sanguineus]|nr:hypothetical protein [Coxiella-like endosymbiont of Rhipicephalus sanguineus]
MWVGLAISSALALGALSTTQTTSQKIGKSLGLILFIYGIALVTSAVSRNTNPLHPFLGMLENKKRVKSDLFQFIHFQKSSNK